MTGISIARVDEHAPRPRDLPASERPPRRPCWRALKARYGERRPRRELVAAGLRDLTPHGAAMLRAAALVNAGQKWGGREAAAAARDLHAAAAAAFNGAPRVSLLLAAAAWLAEAAGRWAGSEWAAASHGALRDLVGLAREESAAELLARLDQENDEQREQREQRGER